MKTRLILFYFFLSSLKLVSFAQTTAQSLTLPEGPSLSGLSFVDSTLGFACGFNGRILKTTNSGDSWQELSSGTTSQINGLVSINAEMVYACTESGQLLSTSDGGLTWTSEQISNVPLTKIYFHHNRLFVLSENGNLFINPQLGFGNLTIPIGGPWANLDQMFWINDQLGFLMADSTHAFAGQTALYRTTNGGNTWNRVPKIQSREGSFSDTIYRDFCWNNLHHIDMLPDSSLLMAGGYYLGYIWKSTDKGLTFKIKDEILQVNPLQIEVMDAQRVALVSWEGDALFPYIARNRNGGNSWHVMINDTNLFRLPYPFKPWGKATFFGPKLVFIPGYNQNINGSLTGAIMRVRNIYPELFTEAKHKTPQEQVLLYPVPASNELILEGLKQGQSATIFSSQGQSISIPSQEKNNALYWDVSTLPKGFYLLKWNKGSRKFWKD